MKLQISKAMFGNDMFGRLLYLLVSKNIILIFFFQYPLLPEPCFVHSDESLHESKKPVFHFLKEKTDDSSPSNVNAVITD